MIPQCLNFMCQHFGTHCLSHLHPPPMKMEQIECSKTSEHKIPTIQNHPKERLQHSEHGKSLKSRRKYLLFATNHLKMGEH